MRTTEILQMSLGQIAIEDIALNPDSRDDIPAILRGLQAIYRDAALKQRIFAVLSKHLLAEPAESAEAGQDSAATLPATRIDASTGRPGMPLWNILVLGVLKQALHCDFDRLHELAHKHLDVRQMLGLSEQASGQPFAARTLVRNVSLLTPELLREVNQLVVESGQVLAGCGGGTPIAARADSFVVETDVHYPTDVSLLWDAGRCLIGEAAALSEVWEVPGWRQQQHLQKKLRQLFQRVRTAQRRSGKQAPLKAYLKQALRLAQRGKETLAALGEAGASAASVEDLEGYVELVEKLADQVRRRVLEGEQIAQQEKIYSVFEPHTRWCAKGKAGKAVELGVPVTVMESRQQFVLNWRVMWEEEDVDTVAVFVKETKELYADLAGCSFDKGYASRANLAVLEEQLEWHGMPVKGRPRQADLERQEQAEYQAARQQHPGVESAINNLEQRGLDRVLSYGKAGFARTVGLAVVAANVHRMGVILRDRERAQRKRASLPLAA